MLILSTDFFISLSQFFGTFFIFSCGGKTSSANFGNAADNNEAFGIDAVGKAFYFSDFAVGNDRHNNFGFVTFITGFRMKKSYAAVDLGKNSVFDFMSFSCNDFDFGSGFSENKSFIKEEGIYESENNSVKDKIHGFEHCKKNHNDKIQSIKGC